MEPVFRPFRSHFLTLQTFVTRSRDFKASAHCIRLNPQIAGFRGTKDVPILRFEHVTLESILPRVWETISTGAPMVKRCDGINL